MVRRAIIGLAALAICVAAVSQAKAGTPPTCKKTLVSVALRTAETADIKNRSCKTCVCGPVTIVTTKHVIKVVLKADGTCDEALLQGEPTLVLNMTRVMRHDGPCDEPVGYHYGKFRLVDASGAVVAKGKFQGTDSYDTELGITDCQTCDNNGRQEGYLEGKSLRSSELGSIKIRLTYTVAMDPGCECTVLSYDAKFAGVIEIKCPY